MAIKYVDPKQTPQVQYPYGNPVFESLLKEYKDPDEAYSYYREGENTEPENDPYQDPMFQDLLKQFGGDYDKAMRYYRESDSYHQGMEYPQEEQFQQNVQPRAVGLPNEMRQGFFNR